jgi:hypothetical protein
LKRGLPFPLSVRALVYPFPNSDPCNYLRHGCLVHAGAHVLLAVPYLLSCSVFPVPVLALSSMWPWRYRRQRHVADTEVQIHVAGNNSRIHLVYQAALFARSLVVTASTSSSIDVELPDNGAREIKAPVHRVRTETHPSNT